jgi:hypothetical protein
MCGLLNCHISGHYPETRIPIGDIEKLLPFDGAEIHDLWMSMDDPPSLIVIIKPKGFQS